MTTSSNTDRFRAFSALLGIALAVGVLMLVWGAEPATAAFPGTNGKIAFISDRNDPNAGTENSTACEIFVMDPNGSNPTNLTNDTTKCDESPTFSPDGSKIAFNTNPDGNGAEIYVMDANGSNRTRLTNNEVDDNPPAFSHDGTKVTFASTMDGGADPEIYVMDASDTDGDGVGDNLTQLTDNSARDIYPVFSPREDKIAFVSNRGGDWNIYLMDARGSRVKKITNDALVEELPNFSPDGSEIVYDVFDESSVGASDADIYVVDADGTGTPTNLTNTPTTWEDKPAFAPSGEQIVFRQHGEPYFAGDSEIYVMNSHSSGRPTNLTNNAAGDWMPDWGIDASPTVIGTSPANAATGVERDTNVSATFSEKMDPTTINTSTFKLYRWNKKRRQWVLLNSASTTVDYDPSSNTAMLDPYGDTTTLLAANRKYKAVVTTGAKDTNGVALSDNFAWTFTTGSS